MLKTLHRYARQIALLIENLPQDGTVVRLSCANPERFGDVVIKKIYALHAAYGIEKNIDQNPSFYTTARVDTSSLPLPAILQRAVSNGAVYMSMDKDTGLPIASLWMTFLAGVAATLGHQPIFCAFEADAGHKTFFLRLGQGSVADFKKTVAQLETALATPFELSIEEADVSAIRKNLFARHEAATEFYLQTDAEWTQRFYQRLGDDLSRASLQNFLRQRIWASIFWACDTYYTLTPPVESAAWRRQRLEEASAMPPFSAPQPEIFFFFYLHTFVWEQYAIPGIVEPKPGDVILDVGAGFGDTAVYFSQKLQGTGTIYSFEPLKDNLLCLKQNISHYKCHNVVTVQHAVSDAEVTLQFKCPEFGVSTSGASMGEIGGNGASGMSGLEPVTTVTIDTFARQNNIRVNFIKADIEGMELPMLKGAQKTLQCDKPSCALSLYHKKDDFRVLPQFLEDCCPEYRFFIRCDAEPMLFATVR